MSAGQRGTQLRVPTTAFISLVKARVAEISTCEPE
jgi:prolyl-tRNA editing enzyme YbaK/EbsC (Cys-tRNA(Pro) deacylase)